MFQKVFVIMGVLLLISAGLLGGCSAQPSLDSQLHETLQAAQITALEPPASVDAALITLGQALFFDKEISGNRDTSCATCHHPLLNTGDGLSLSIGAGGAGLGPARALGEGHEFIPRNAPEVFNRGYAEWGSMFWDSRVTGNAADGFSTPAGDKLPDGLNNVLAVQAMFPPTSDAEMRGFPGDVDVFGQPNELAMLDGDDVNAIWDGIMARLIVIPEYQTLFQAAYPDIPVDELGFQRVANAIAAFEIDAWTFTDSPWDRYLAGDNTALSEQAKRGALLFYGEAGCARCHAGNLLTDQKHHNIAAPQFGPGKGDGNGAQDFGRGRETGVEADMFAFRTPPLRNVALTGPWLHNGAYQTLEAVVLHHLSPETALQTYDESQLTPDLAETCQTDEAAMNAVLETLDPFVSKPTTLTHDEVQDLLAFLHALTSPSAVDLRADVPVSVPSGLALGD